MILAPAARRQIGFPTSDRTTFAVESALDGPLVREPAPAAPAPLFQGRPEDGRQALASLWVRAGLQGARQLEVYGPTVRIGRSPANDVVLPEESVGQDQAELRLRGGVWTLRDLGSPNGTWVDGSPAAGEVPLAPGSTLQLGRVSLAFAPHDRWEDSPAAERRMHHTLFVLPERRRPLWPRLVFVGAALGLVALILWYLLGQG